jgi:hypothetical protein
MAKSSTLEEGVDVVIVPLRGALGRLIFAGLPWVTSQFPSIIIGYSKEILSKLYCLVLYTKYIYIFGPTCQVGQVPLTGRRVFW